MKNEFNPDHSADNTSEANPELRVSPAMPYPTLGHRLQENVNPKNYNLIYQNRTLLVQAVKATRHFVVTYTDLETRKEKEYFDEIHWNLWLKDYKEAEFRCEVWDKVMWIKFPKYTKTEINKEGEEVKKVVPQFISFLSKKPLLDAYVKMIVEAGIAVPDINFKDFKRVKGLNTAVERAIDSKLYPNLQIQLYEHKCECNCPQHKGWEEIVKIDTKMASLIEQHPMLHGNMPDPHTLAVLHRLGLSNFSKYSYYYQKAVLSTYGMSFKYVKEDLMNVYHKETFIGELKKDYVSDHWIPKKKHSKDSTVKVDDILHRTPLDAALHLAHKLALIDLKPEVKKEEASAVESKDSPAVEKEQTKETKEMATAIAARPEEPQRFKKGDKVRIKGSKRFPNYDKVGTIVGVTNVSYQVVFEGDSYVYTFGDEIVVLEN